jgi:hypothetical protein
VQYYLDKFGPRVSQIVPQMEKIYADMGLKYSLGGGYHFLMRTPI